MQDSDKENRGFNTLAVHAGEGVGATDTRSSATPIHQMASYLLENVKKAQKLFALEE